MSFSLKIPDSFHAFLVADVQIHDPGKGYYVDVCFADGTQRRARASAEVLRMGSAMIGHHRATLHFRTDELGFILDPMHLYRVRSIYLPLPHQGTTYWSSLGIKEYARNSIMIYPELAKAHPFKISFQEFQDVEHEIGSTLHVQGYVEKGRLIASEIRKTKNHDIPHRWKGWINK